MPETVAVERASGGRASTWLCGGTVLKRADLSEGELSWHASVLRDVLTDAFRVAVPIAATNGRFIFKGWCATGRLLGIHQTNRWTDIVRVGTLFHRAVQSAERPSFLDARTDRWSIGDRVAWGELDAASLVLDTSHIERLLTCRQPVTGTNQLIHGDLTGNVLFHPTLPPAIIDVTPYWRPPEFATAIVVADALVWEGADDTLIDDASVSTDFGQYLVRALIYRIVTDRLGKPDDSPTSDAFDPYHRAVELACFRCQ